MSDVRNKIRWTAMCMARMLRESPDMSWEDVQGINRRVGFAHMLCQEDYSDLDDLRVGRGRLSRADLREAWELAQSMAPEGRREWPSPTAGG